MARNKQGNIEMGDLFEEASKKDRNLINLFSFGISKESYEMAFPLIAKMEEEFKLRKGNIPGQLQNFFKMLRFSYFDCEKQEFILTLPIDNYEVTKKILHDLFVKLDDGIEQDLYNNTHQPGYQCFILEEKEEKNNFLSYKTKKIINNITNGLLVVFPCVIKSIFSEAACKLLMKSKLENIYNSLVRTYFLQKYIKKK